MKAARSNWSSEYSRTGKGCAKSLSDAAQPSGAGNGDTFALDQSLLSELGHEVIVAHAREIEVVTYDDMLNYARRRRLMMGPAGDA